MRSFDEIYNAERMNRAIDDIVNKLNQMRNITGSECKRMEDFSKKLSVISYRFEKDGEVFKDIEFNTNEKEKNPYDEYWEAKMYERINTSSMYNDKPDNFNHEVTRLLTIARGFYYEHIQYCKEIGEDPEDIHSFVSTAKRPYGNKNVPASICFNLGWGYVENDYLPKFVEDECWRLHKAVISKLKDE